MEKSSATNVSCYSVGITPIHKLFYACYTVNYTPTPLNTRMNMHTCTQLLVLKVTCAKNVILFKLISLLLKILH